MNVVTENMPFDTEQDYERESEILKVLGHPIRLKIVAGLMSQSCNVKKIWECLSLPQATVSQHLALLKNKDIITGRREGVEVYYQVTSPEAMRIVVAIFGDSISCS
jgi:ArsR family transcriptional regulator